MVWPPFVAAVAEELLLLLIDVFFNVVVVGADVFVAERRFDGGPVASTSPTWNKTEERRASRFVSIKRVSLFFFSMVKDTFFLPVRYVLRKASFFSIVYANIPNGKF